MVDDWAVYVYRGVCPETVEELKLRGVYWRSNQGAATMLYNFFLKKIQEKNDQELGVLLHDTNTNYWIGLHSGVHKKAVAENKAKTELLKDVLDQFGF